MTSARYRGMNAETGETLTDNEHISQSINDILLTPVSRYAPCLRLAAQ